jgi:signal transduction histidine kinase/HPt (histidine-containing phosphotransfer) domain-containing protein
LKEIKQHQTQVIQIVDELMNRVKFEALQAVKTSHEELNQTYIIMIALTLSIIFLAITIAHIVSHYVNKKNHDLMDAMKVKSRFLANMSHEVRTPLTAIIGFAENLLDPNLDAAERRSTINTIIRNGAHLQHIVDEILDLSRDEANRLEVNKNDLFLLELIAEIEATFRVAAQKKGLLFEVNYQVPLPEKIHSDAVKLKQILYNLCNNAVKYTERGKVTLTVSYNINAHQVHFDVMDSGIGISQSDINQIFDPFVQVDTSSTRKFGGAGLGLHLSYRFAQLLGGALSVDSDYGHGSCFTLSLPGGPVEDNALVYEINQQDLLSLAHTKVPNTTGVTGNILIAEDTKDNQLLFRAYLKDTNIKLTTVDNGKQALTAAFQGNFDVILMDIQMPIMNGFDALNQLRNKGWNGPVLALTANVLPEDCQRYFEMGFNDVIGKPVTRHVFLEKVTAFLPKKTPDESPAIYSTLLDEGPEFLPAIKHFVQQAPGECAQLLESFKNKNWPELQRQLHRLKGSGGGVGFPMVTELAKQAEDNIKNRNFATIEPNINKLIAILHNLEVGESSQASH